MWAVLASCVVWDRGIVDEIKPEIGWVGHDRVCGEATRVLQRIVGEVPILGNITVEADCLV